MTCNINKVVMCFLLSAFGLCLFFWSTELKLEEISRYRLSSGNNCHYGLEKLHEAITPTVSCVQ